jgi:alginate O-acetyltransferase complex protein AlgI
VYIPLGGSRRGPFRTCANLLIVFALCGFWHGPTWLFLFWGLYHGAFLMLERTPFGQLLRRAPRVLVHLYAVLVVIFGWILFRSPSLDYAFGVWKAMLGGNGWDNASIVWPERIPMFNNFTCIILLTGVAASLPWVEIAKPYLSFANEQSWFRFAMLAYPIVVGMLMVVSFAFVSTQSHLAFIYFRF